MKRKPNLATKLRRVGRKLGKLLVESLAEPIVDFDVALRAAEDYAEHIDAMTDEQRTAARGRLAELRAMLAILAMPADARLERECSLIVLEAKFARLHPLAGPLAMFERIAEHITEHGGKPDDLAETARAFEELRNSELITSLAEHDPEAYAASMARLDAVRAAVIAREGN